MKNFKSILVSTILVIAITITSCKDKVETKEATETTVATEALGKEYTSTYVCPMHCEGSGSDAEGKCASCGMALVLNEDHKVDGHTHE